MVQTRSGHPSKGESDNENDGKSQSGSQKDNREIVQLSEAIMQSQLQEMMDRMKAMEVQYAENQIRAEEEAQKLANDNRFLKERILLAESQLKFKESEIRNRDDDVDEEWEAENMYYTSGMNTSGVRKDKGKQVRIGATSQQLNSPRIQLPVPQRRQAQNEMPMDFMYQPDRSQARGREVHVAANNFQVSPALYSACCQHQFHGMTNEDPHDHIDRFLELCDTVKINGVTQDQIRLKCFTFTLVDKARVWYRSLDWNYIQNWEDLCTEFLRKFFPPSKTIQLQNEITEFQQGDEKFHECWERFKELVSRCPQHGFSDGQLIQTFYRGLDEETQYRVDAAASGSLSSLTPSEGKCLIEKIALAGERWSKGKKPTKKLFAVEEDSSSLKAEVKLLRQEEEVNMMQQRQYDYNNRNYPYPLQGNSNYHPDNRYHKNFSYANPDNALQPPPGFGQPQQKKPQTELEARCERLESMVVEMQKSISAMAKSMSSFHQVGKLPSDTIVVEKEKKVEGAMVAEVVRNEVFDSTLRFGMDEMRKIVKDAIKEYMEEQKIGKINEYREARFPNVDRSIHSGSIDRTSSIETSRSSQLEQIEGFQKHIHDRSIVKQIDRSASCHQLDRLEEESYGKFVGLVELYDVHERTNFLGDDEFGQGIKEFIIEEFDFGEPYVGDNTEVAAVEEVEDVSPRVHKRGNKKNNIDEGKLYEIFSNINVNLPFLNVLQDSPRIAKYLKEALKRKQNVKQVNRVELTSQSSDLIMKGLPEKKEDPGSFTIPCAIGGEEFEKALCDLGASVNIMPYYVFCRLNLNGLRPINVSIQMADQSKVPALGIVRDVLVKVNDLIFPADFIVLETNNAGEVPIILGRPFLATADADIKVAKGQIILKLGDEFVRFSMNKKKEKKVEKWIQKSTRVNLP